MTEKEFYESLKGALPLQTVASLSKRWNMSLQLVKYHISNNKDFPKAIKGFVESGSREVKLFKMNEIKEFEDKYFTK